MRTFKVGGNVVCRDCWEKARQQAEEDGKFWFYPNIPAFVEGVDLTLEIFDNFESFLARLEKYHKVMINLSEVMITQL